MRYGERYAPLPASATQLAASSAFTDEFTPAGVGFKSGASRYYGSPYSGAVSTGLKTQATVYYSPLLVPNACTINQIAMVVVSAGGSVGSVYRLGLYASDADGEPGALVVDGGTVDTTTTGTKTATISQAVTPGLYWMAACPQGAPATQATVYVCTLGAMLNLPIATVSNLEPRGFTQASVTGAFPANATPAVNDGVTTPRVLVRVA